MTGFICGKMKKKKKLQAHIEEEESALFFFLYTIQECQTVGTKKGKKKEHWFFKSVGGCPLFFLFFGEGGLLKSAAVFDDR